MAYALSRDAWWRLLLFASAPAYVAANSVQWSPILSFAALTPPTLWLVIAKPNLTMPFVAYQTNRRAIVCAGIGAAALGLVSLAVRPDWPIDWAATLRGSKVADQYVVPILTRWGFVFGFAALRWRTREGRLLLALACVPQNFYFYDQLPLLLVARSRKALLALCCTSWIAYLTLWVRGIHVASWAEVSIQRSPYVMLGLYLPALLLVLFGHRTHVTSARESSSVEPMVASPL